MDYKIMHSVREKLILTETASVCYSEFCSPAQDAKSHLPTMECNNKKWGFYLSTTKLEIRAK
jgi:hypothetical protein